MPTLNDFGEAGYQKVVAQLDAFAANLGIPKEIIRQYWSDTAHLPQSLDELKAWGMKPDREYNQTRYDPTTGRWTPLAQGPTPGYTDLQRGGFPHFINNNVGDAQRFQQVDAQGNIFGGSWDPAANAAHPEWAGRPAAAGIGDAGLRQQIQGGRSAQGFDSNNYVAPTPSGVGFVSVVNGVPQTFGTQNEAENDYNQRSGGGSTQGAPPAGPSAGAVGPGGAGPAASPATGATPGAAAFNPSAASAANAAVLAFLEQRRIDEIEKPDLALKTQTELAQMRRDDSLAVWKQAYEAATLTGNLNGAPTLDATKQQADLTGYTGQGYASAAQAAFNNLPPAQRTADAAARIWQNVAPGLSPQEAAQIAQAGRDYYLATGQVMPDAVAAQHLSQITGGRVTGTGAQATPAFQHQQNQDAISALTLLSNQRGPENAFAYANTLANIPDSVRQAIGAAQSTLPLTPRNPAQAGLLGDVTGRTGLGQAQQQVQTGQPAMVATSPPGMAPGGGGTPMDQYRAGAGPATGVGGPTPMGRIVDDGSAPVGPTGQPAWYATPGAVTGPRTATTQPGMGSALGLPTQQTQQTQSFMRMDPATQARLLGGATQQGGPAMTYQGPQLGGVYGPRTQPIRPATAAGMMLPGQISPTDYNRTGVYGRNLMWAGYENVGEDKTNVQDEYQRSLPVATGPRTGRLRVA